MIYLDNQATTPCDPAVVAEMLPWFGEWFGNPHSAEHAMGRRAAAAVEVARGEVAALIGAEAREIVFTSGATEANNLAIKGAARFAGAGDGRARRIITVATEHKCVLESVAALRAEGFEPVVLPVGGDGVLDLDVLGAALRTPTLLVSVMAANNETGVLQDLAGVARLARAAGALVHADLAQAAGKVGVDVAAWGLHLASLSAHKMYGPKGMGALYVRRRPRVRLAPLFSGGGQERGMRSGTLPAPLVVGFGAAARLARAGLAEEAARVGALRDRFERALAARLPVIWTTRAARVPGAASFRVRGVRALDVLAAVPELCLSTGSACTSAEVAPSHVLTAMGLGADEAAATLRVGIGRFTSAADVDRAAALLCEAYARLSYAAAPPAVVPPAVVPPADPRAVPSVLQPTEA